MNKAELRKEMLAERTKLSKTEIAEGSAKVMRNLFSIEEFLSAETVGFYMPIKGEIDTQGMIKRALIFGKTILLPKIVSGKMRFCEFMGFGKLKKGVFDIPEPCEDEECEAEVLIVPGVAFDLHRHRLGFGKGHYDQYLAKHHAFAIGVCYEWQLIGKIAWETHDRQMDKIIAGDWIIE